MVKILLTFLFLFISADTVFSQDTIVKVNGEIIQAKVTEITFSEVKYKRFDNLNGPTIIDAKHDVLEIIYENGTKKYITEEERKIDSTNMYAGADLYNRGQRDARKYYGSYQGAGTVTFITSLLSPLVGLIPAIACSSTPPSEVNLNFPKENLMKNADYRIGYKDRAKKSSREKYGAIGGLL